MTGIFRRAQGYIYTAFRSCDYSTSSSHLNPARSGKKSHEALRMSSNSHVWWMRWIIMFQDFTRCIPWDWMSVTVTDLKCQSTKLACCPCPRQCWARVTWERCLGDRCWKLGGCIGFSLLNGLSDSYSNNYFLSHRISIKWSQAHGFTYGEWLQRQKIRSAGAAEHNTEQISLLWM